MFAYRNDASLFTRHDDMTRDHEFQSRMGVLVKNLRLMVAETRSQSIYSNISRRTSPERIHFQHTFNCTRFSSVIIFYSYATWVWHISNTIRIYDISRNMDIYINICVWAWVWMCVRVFVWIYLFRLIYIIYDLYPMRWSINISTLIMKS